MIGNLDGSAPIATLHVVDRVARLQLSLGLNNHVGELLNVLNALLVLAEHDRGVEYSSGALVSDPGVGQNLFSGQTRGTVLD